MGGRNRRVSTRAEGHLESEVSEQDAEGLLTFVQATSSGFHGFTADEVHEQRRAGADVFAAAPRAAACVDVALVVEHAAADDLARQQAAAGEPGARVRAHARARGQPQGRCHRPAQPDRLLILKNETYRRTRRRAAFVVRRRLPYYASARVSSIHWSHATVETVTVPRHIRAS